MQRKNLDDLTANKQFNMLIDKFTSYIRTSSQNGITTVNNSIMAISYPHHDKHKLTFIFADGVKNTLWLPENKEPHWSENEPKTNVVLSPTAFKESLKEQVVKDLYTQ